MNRSTIIKAIVAGGIVIAGVILGDNERVRQKVGKTIDIANDIERAVKNPFSTFASSVTSQQHHNANYWDWQIREDEYHHELERLKLQHAHEERMAELNSKAKETEDKKEETV